jgi:hypothetical protein
MTSLLVPLALLVLALTDAAFCGYRDAAGRNPLIRKASFYRRALRRGIRFGFANIGLATVLLGVLLVASPYPGVLWADCVAAGTNLLCVVAPYATIVLMALGAWTAAEQDVRTLASVALLGPLTLLRPVVVLAGAAVAITTRPSIPVTTLAVATAVLQLSMGPLLGRAWRGRDPLDGDGV